MKLIETTKPVARTFTLELNEDELKLIMCCLPILPANGAGHRLLEKLKLSSGYAAFGDFNSSNVGV